MPTLALQVPDHTIIEREHLRDAGSPLTFENVHFVSKLMCEKDTSFDSGMIRLFVGPSLPHDSWHNLYRR